MFAPWLFFCPATHSRHRRACPCIVAARRVGKMRTMRTRWPRHRRFRRVAFLSPLVGLDRPHTLVRRTRNISVARRCPTWLSLPCLRFLFLTLFSFLVPCFAAELLGSMGRTKDRASKMSQGLSNNAVLEVTVQLRLQYQELLNLQASQQCVKETLKTQACHTPCHALPCFHGSPCRMSLPRGRLRPKCATHLLRVPFFLRFIRPQTLPGKT